MAHEAAHIFAAKGHFGAGLMAEGGGDGSSWFSDEDIKELCKKISGFHAAAEPGGGEGNKGKIEKSGGGDVSGSQCGNEGIVPSEIAVNGGGGRFFHLRFWS